MRLAIVLVAILAIPVLAHAATLKVPSQYPTIQDAIDAASGGDTVLVAPGTYVENINFKAKAITVTGDQGPNVTIIDANQTGSAVLFNGAEKLDSVLEGFTLTNGSGTFIPSVSSNAGGAVCCDESSPTIRSCHIRNNYCDSGAGIFMDASSPSILSNLFFDNGTIDFPVTGSGIYMRNLSAPEVQNNAFYRNAAYAGGGIYIGNSSPTVVGNTFYGNTCQKKGGGIWYQHVSGPEAVITNNILWNDTAAFQPEISVDSGNPIVTYCDVEGGWTGTGNIDADPLFFDPANGDLHLKQDPCQPGVTNPCVDSGSGTAFNLGMHACWTRTDGVPDSGIVDMGFHYGPFTLPSLFTDTAQISESMGGVAKLSLVARQDNAFRHYIVLGSVTGINPGTPLPGGKAVLPLNWDSFTNIVLAFLNTPIFTNFMSTLNSYGESAATFDTLGPIPGAAGATLYFAFALNNPWDFVSNPVGIEIVP